MLVWSSFSLNWDMRTPPHKGSGNASSPGFLTTLTHNEGGSLWIEEEGGTVYEEDRGILKRGHTYSPCLQGLFFQSNCTLHSTCSWSFTNRITLAAYCIGHPQQLGARQVHDLEHLGFQLPKSQG